MSPLTGSRLSGCRQLFLLASLWTTAVANPATVEASEWISALDEKRVMRTGDWAPDRFRFAEVASLRTSENRARLVLSFEGTGFSIRLGGHNVPAYGPPNLGRLDIAIDGHFARTIRPMGTPRELVVAEGLEKGRHEIRITHRPNGEKSGCRIEGFRTWKKPHGHLNFRLSGDQNAFLVDARAVLSRGKTVVRNVLVRNWLTGQCGLAGLPPGDDYSLALEANGWSTETIKPIKIMAGKTRWRQPVYMQRRAETVIHRFRFPRLNQQAIRRPGETFRARFLGFDAKIDSVRLVRTVGSAVISRKVEFQEDIAAKYYYDREVVATLPDDMPPGLYDLFVNVTGGRRTGSCRSPRSVHVVTAYPRDPVLVTFGHLDTSAQYQAEYLERLAGICNLVGADLVLSSNACNPAYVSGSLSRLQVPYVVNFGNHQFPGHEAWFGDPVGRIDFGPQISVLNFGHPWHIGTERADRLLGERRAAEMKIINAFEANAPVEFFDRHQVRMIHDGHGTGTKVMDVGATPTRRIGKSNSISFRVVRLKDNRVVTCTYAGHETAPVPFSRSEMSPVKARFLAPNDGTRSSNSAMVTNRLKDAFPNGRVTFLMPAGEYTVGNARVESSTKSDDGRHVVLVTRLDIPSSGEVRVTVQPRSK